MSLTRKPAFTLAALAAAGSMALAGCGSGSTAESGTATESGSADGKVSLTFETWLPTQDQWTDLVAAFEKENPNITIDFQRDEDYDAFKTKLDNNILANDMPDVYGIQAGSSFDDYAQYAMPVKDYASDWISKISDNSRKQTTTTDGTEAAVPILNAGMEYFLYNKTILDELGLAVPTTYDELVTFAKAARDKGYTPMAMGAADAWHDSDFFVWLANQYGPGDIYKAAAGDIPWDSDSLVQAGTAWQKLFTDGIFQEGATTTTTYPSARDDYFLARKAVGMPTGSWHASATLSTSPEVPGSAVAKDQIGMATFPQVGPTDSGVTSGVDFALAISDSVDDAKKDAAAKFVQFMAVGTGQQDWVNTLQGFPVAEGVSIQVGDNESELAKSSLAEVTDTLAKAKYPRKLTVPGKDSLENDLGVVLQNIANGSDV